MPAATASPAHGPTRACVGIRCRVRPAPSRLRRAPHPLRLAAHALGRHAGRSSDPAQARRPHPHRRAQDQQRDRPGAARTPDGQAAGDRRDRRGPARRGHRHRLRAARPRCVVYMGAEDMARQQPNVLRMELLGAKVVPVDERHPHAERRHQRGDPRLGHERRARPTTSSAPSLGPHPYPMIVRDFQSRDRRRSARADSASTTGRLPDVRRRLRRRRLERHRHFLRRSCERRGGRLIGVEAGGRGIDPRRARGPLHRRQRSACCTARARACCRTTTVRSPRRTRSRAGLDYPASGPSTPSSQRHGPRRVRAVTTTPRRSPRSSSSPSSRASSPRSSPRTRSPGCALAAEPGADELALVCLSGRGDKDLAEVISLTGT